MENQLITLLRIKTAYLGSFVKDKLEEHGFEVFFTNEGLTLGEKYDPREVLLKVKAGQSEKAIATLLQLHKEFDLDEIRDMGEIKQLKKILVPVKISDCCFDLCEYAIGLASRQNAEVKILYVYPDPTFADSQKSTTSWEKIVNMQLKEAFDKAQLKLVEFSKELKARIPKELMRSVKVHYRMLKGTPVNVITESCKRYKPDVVVMGTRQDKEGNGEFCGKTLMKVIENTQYPVLGVPEGAKFKSKAKINVMYATDFYESDNSSLNKLLEILKSYDKKIYCVHIATKNDLSLQKKIDELNTFLKSDYPDVDITCVSTESESVPKGLDDFIESHDIDLISLSKQKHSAFYRMFHSDLVEAMVSSKKIPMLIFPV
ncbi:universal stress protein [Maribellus sp. YY47]|uniref:universal stress protein n=1 Tax=Maribellus sp. YY47 TaxID=2929486 RepID=UPI002000FC3C|nr:universal stress protein [Maribellus sp. YY47]MCK3684484.1 universal stress protein [Maribellus sp. YY47]